MTYTSELLADEIAKFAERVPGELRDQSWGDLADFVTVGRHAEERLLAQPRLSRRKAEETLRYWLGAVVALIEATE